MSQKKKIFWKRRAFELVLENMLNFSKGISELRVTVRTGSGSENHAACYEK